MVMAAQIALISRRIAHFADRPANGTVALAVSNADGDGLLVARCARLSDSSAERRLS